jgi:uracil phosphoribosyltransferase
MIHNLSKSPSIIHEYMRALRDVSVQGNKANFRQNIQRIGRVMGFEMSKHLEYHSADLQTPLAEMKHPVLNEQPVIITILRAGLPLQEGLLDAFPDADSGFIAAYRKHVDGGDDFVIDAKYTACPPIEDRVLILNDPMLATGQSFLTAWEVLKQLGTPRKLLLGAVIASAEGVEMLERELDVPFDLWVGAIDPALNEQKYIVPGLGDAGDLAFGTKLQQ